MCLPLGSPGNQIPISKFQIPNNIQLPNDQISKKKFRSFEIRIWVLFEIWCLDIGAFEA
jgi:hypothetical protein